MPFGVVGSSPLVDGAQNSLFSLDVTEYPDEAAVTQAMDRGEIYGALIADTSGASSQLTVVSSISDLAPLDIASNFEAAAKTAGETVTVKAYAPTPLAPKDPYALVIATLLIPLLVGGYVATALLTGALGTASGRWRGLWLLGFAVVTGLVIDLIVTYAIARFRRSAVRMSMIFGYVSRLRAAGSGPPRTPLSSASIAATSRIPIEGAQYPRRRGEDRSVRPRTRRPEWSMTHPHAPAGPRHAAPRMVHTHRILDASWMILANHLQHEKAPHQRGFGSGGTQIRTGDTTIFSRVLYQLSYPAEPSRAASER